MVGADEILAGLDEQQRIAATAVEGPVLILAGAGSGKTRTITRRIAYASAVGAQRPDRGLAVTFTAKAAGQMRARLAELDVSGLSAMTFHSAALRQLRHFWPAVVGGPAPDLVAAKAPYVTEAAASLGLSRERTVIRDLAAEIEWAKVTRLTPEAYPAAAAAAGRAQPGGLSAGEVASVYRVYGAHLAERGRMDFEDVLALTVGMLADRPDLADQVRQRYRWITVDEYQDLSALQHALLGCWLGESDQICVVGDPGQTIYSFAGASAHYLADFRRQFPNAATVPLDQSYRCSPEIIAVANRVLAPARRSAQHPLLRLTSQQPSGPQPRIMSCPDDVAEADQIAAGVAQWRAAGTPARQIAVLVRSNAATAPIEEAFAAAGIPYVVTGGERFFARAEVREAVVRLRGAANAAAGPGAGLSAEVAEVLAAMGFHAGAPPAGRGAARDRWESLAALAALAGDVADCDPAAGLRDLVAELDRRAGLDAEPVADGVTLATLHAAKGLEWDAVWIAGVAEGSLPIGYATTPEALAEERRLCYVGITRARRELALSWAVHRSGDRANRRSPSRFLQDIADGRTVTAEGLVARTGQRRPTRAPSRRAGLGRCRRCGRGLPTPAERALQRCRQCPEEIDLALFERLRRWRADQVAASGAPAYTVLTDTTLRAIAELLPVSDEDLLRISGVGPAKAERYGPALLAMVAERG
jgi:DNA helicase-2/ATP-dependent DNA helicase PcrA